MKKLILFSVFSLAFITGKAQVKSFTTDINDSFYNNFQSFSLRQTSDGGYIQTGYVPLSQTIGNIYLIKLDAYGKKRWYHIITDTFLEDSRTIRQTADGGFAIGGSTDKNGNFDFLLDKFDSAGNLLWSKTYGTANNVYAISMQLTKDGGYIIAGYSESSNTSFSTFDLGYVVKINSKGNTTWTMTFDDTTNQSRAYSISQTSDGGYIVGGYKVIDTLYNYVYILKIDSNGKKTWDKTYGDPSHVFDFVLFSIIQAKDGSYIATGKREVDSTSGSSSNVFVFKANSNGDSLWLKAYAGDSSAGRDITQAKDGEYVVTGANSVGINDEVYLLKMSSSGIKRWEKNLPTVTDGTGSSIMQTTDGGYALSGYQIINSDYFGALAIKTDTSGNVPGPVDTLYVPDNNSVNTGISQSNINPESIITLYPNPFNTQTTIYVKNITLQQASLSIYSLDGKEINQVENISGNQIYINRNNLSNGVYLYRLVNNGQVISTGKIIVE